MKTDSDCIFCKIVAGDIPVSKVLEDDAAIGFMDIGPVAEGHALLIPKEHYETIGDVPKDVAAAVLGRLPQLVAAVEAVTGCQGVNILQNNGAIAGQLVPHVHFHVIPRNPTGEFHFNWPASKYPEGRMEELGSKIKEAIDK
jgi:histidine triad (HIT) family protein